MNNKPSSRRHLGKHLRIVLGVGLIIIGLAGLVLPFLQGFLFIAAGLLLLSESIPALRPVFGWLERKFPKTKRLKHTVDREIDRLTPFTVILILGGLLALTLGIVWVWKSLS